MKVATTTSLYDTGLWDYLETIFEERYNADLQIASVGTGTALTYGRNGDVDVVAVHDPTQEAAFMPGNVGEHTAKLIVKHLGSMEKLMYADAPSLLQIREIGTEVAGSVVRFFQQKGNRATIMRLHKAGVSFEAAGKNSGSVLDGITFVFTGTLQEYTRQEATRLVEERGGKVTSLISDKTTYLVAGADAGSKLNKAWTLGVQILTEEQFKALVR